MGLGLKALRNLASLDVVDRAGLREPLERLVHTSTRNGFRTAVAAGRAFKATQKLGSPARQSTTTPRKLFDLTPSDEQQMLQEAFGDFATARLRPVAQEADDAPRKRPRSC